MSSIIWRGDTFHGISVFGRGVFTNDERGGRLTYAGQIREGYACGLAVLTLSSGTKVYAEHGPAGQFDGRWLLRDVDGRTYSLYERGEEKDCAGVYADGTCTFNGEFCAPDDPRLLALIAQVAPVEVRPAGPSLPPATQTPSNRPMDRPARFAPAGARAGHGHQGASPRRTPYLMAVRHSPTTGAVQRTTTH